MTGASWARVLRRRQGASGPNDEASGAQPSASSPPADDEAPGSRPHVRGHRLRVSGEGPDEGWSKGPRAAPRDATSSQFQMASREFATPTGSIGPGESRGGLAGRNGAPPTARKALRGW